MSHLIGNNECSAEILKFVFEKTTQNSQEQ